jgi:predicted PP-loop superfamily ATPase
MPGSFAILKNQERKTHESNDKLLKLEYYFPIITRAIAKRQHLAETSGNKVNLENRVSTLPKHERVY